MPKSTFYVEQERHNFHFELVPYLKNRFVNIPPLFYWEVKQNNKKKSQSNKSTNMAHTKKKLLYITYNIYRRGVYGGVKKWWNMTHESLYL